MAGIAAVLVWYDEQESVHRPLTDRLCALSLPDHIFQKKFRLDKKSAVDLANELKVHLPVSRLPTILRVLIALRFFATGSYQGAVGNDIYLSVSQSSVSRCIKDVASNINQHLMTKYIKFPLAMDLGRVKGKFHERYGFPGVIGAIDCTHVAIITPVENESITNNVVFFNRKGYASLNVQLIVDSEAHINGINAKFPGSVHDAFIWRQSLARNHISNLGNGWLLGDSGYPLEPCLMTPFLNALPGSIEELYNQRHASARSCVERCNGLLKTRFRCLLKHQTLHYSPTIASLIINACAVLHNICNARNIPLDEELIQDSHDDVDDSQGIFDPVAAATNKRYCIALLMS